MDKRTITANINHLKQFFSPPDGTLFIPARSKNNEPREIRAEQMEVFGENHQPAAEPTTYTTAGPRIAAGNEAVAAV